MGLIILIFLVFVIFSISWVMLGYSILRLTAHINNRKLVWVDKFGFPVECVEGKKIGNFIRLLIHTRNVKLV